MWKGIGGMWIRVEGVVFCHCCQIRKCNFFAVFWLCYESNERRKCKWSIGMVLRRGLMCCEVVVLIGTFLSLHHFDVVHPKRKRKWGKRKWGKRNSGERYLFRLFRFKAKQNLFYAKGHCMKQKIAKRKYKCAKQNGEKRRSLFLKEILYCYFSNLQYSTVRWNCLFYI